MFPSNNLLLILLLHLLPSLVSSLTCYSCYSLSSNSSSSFSDYLPPLLLSSTRDACSHGNTISCPPASTCVFTSLSLLYGEDSAEVTSMGCAGVREIVSCSEIRNTFNHPLFDLDACSVKRCQFDRCNDGGVMMLSGVSRCQASAVVVVVVMNLLFLIS